MNVPPGAVAPLVVLGAGGATKARLARHDAALKRLARVGEISESVAAPPASAQIVLGEATVCLPLGSLIDLNAEAARLRKEQTKVTEEIARLHNKLANARFVANAAAELVAAEREKLAGLQAVQVKLDTALSRLKSDA